MTDLSFVVWQDPSTGLLPQTYYFDLDESGNPVKLGDGSFGIVYRVRNIKDSKVKGNYAVKIFYEGDDIWERFVLELTFMEKIRGIADDKSITRGELISILEPMGGTPKFHESNAYKDLFAKKFSDLKISSYAIVMERYDGTLKDLLEGKPDNLEFTGYEVLRKIPVNDRIKWVLPFIEACINGLRTLYIGNNAHLDLKPANMFYKELGAEFEVVIGDMGYLNPQNDRSLEDKTSHAQDDFRRRPLLGTLHYRSPEQKDNYEICDASVRKTGDNTFELIIQDPKFNDSIIEEMDFVYFSKSQEKHPYTIEHIDPVGTSGQKFTRIILNDKDSEIGIREDPKTQIVIRKRQRLRTDLFAIGAIAYDLLTCGQSPERFYERLRIWDNRHTSIAEIMSSYSRVASFNSSEPQSQHIFESLNFGTEYASAKIVQFILRCMLYNSPGTFYDVAYKKLKEEPTIPVEQIKKTANAPIFDLTIEEKILCDLRDRFRDDFKDYLSENCKLGNPVVFRVKPAEKVSPDENFRLSGLLDIIQRSHKSHFVERYLLGAHYVQQLLNYINEIFDIGRPFYFSEFNPENIVESSFSQHATQRLNTQYIAFLKREDYLKDLRDYKVHIKLKTNPYSFFIPNYLVYIHRPVKLTKLQLRNSSDNSEFRFEYSFYSKTYAYDEVKKGDWVLARKKDNKNELYRIEEVDPKTSEVELLYFDVESGTTLNNRILTLDAPGYEEKDPFVYFKEIDLQAYYLHILGIYVHQFFFARLNGDSTNSLPAIVEMTNTQSFISPKDIYWCKSVDEFLAVFPINDWTKPKQQVFKVMTKLVNLYIRLIFNQLDNSYYKNAPRLTGNNPIRKILSEVQVAFDDIRRDLENLLEVEAGYLNRVRHLEPMLRKSIQGLPPDASPEWRGEMDIIRSANDRIETSFPDEFKFENALEMMRGHKAWTPQPNNLPPAKGEGELSREPTPKKGRWW